MHVFNTCLLWHLLSTYNQFDYIFNKMYYDIDDNV